MQGERRRDLWKDFDIHDYLIAKKWKKGIGEGNLSKHFNLISFKLERLL